MSSITTSKITGFVTGTNRSIAIAASLLDLGVMVGLSVSAQAALKSCTHMLSDAKKQVFANADLRLQQKTIASQTQIQIDQHSLSLLESAKVKAIATFANTGYAIANRAEVAESIQQVMAATTLQQIELAQSQVTKVLEANNHQVLVHSLAVACQNASLKAGFAQITTQTRAGKVRIIARNYTGQALVSEIGTGDQVEIATETVGISDGSCNDIIEKFEKALAEEGVIRQSQTARKFTGGICELSSAQEFLHNPTISEAKQSSTTKASQCTPPRRQQQGQNIQQR